MNDFRQVFNEWETKVEDEILKKELEDIKDNEEEIENSFYRDLAFGTGGLRGVLGVGTNRMNIYTVGKASQGLANYVVNNFKDEDRSIAISYDSRINSDLFAKISAEVFVANGIKVHIYKELMPTPCLSFAVRELKCAAGIMVTASHNPSKYNGYKVYGADGCQITTEAAKAIQEEINKIDAFNDVKRNDFEEELSNGNIKYIEDDVITKFINHVKEESVLYGEEVDKNVSIVYTPLNGTGLKPVLRALKEEGFTNVKVVLEQEKPDGNFPTCPYPNPEIKEAMALGMEYAKKENADLLLATDPDADRCGIAVKDKDGVYQLVSGNETGLLLLSYILERRSETNNLPNKPVFVKTIVTTDLAEKIAKAYNVETINVLTGFKFIGEQIGLLEKDNRENDYICGFEESYGYLTGTYVRDKDAVNAAHMISEMFAYYKSKGISLLEKLEEIYKEYGYALNTLYSYEFDGAKGFANMQKIISEFRNIKETIGEYKIDHINDYSLGIDNLPKSDVIKYFFEGGSSLVVRPSGTEPKLKTYYSINASTKEEAKRIEEEIKNKVEEIIRSV